jgi:DNA-binding transcriptional regulator YhcF (GntR family)
MADIEIVARGTWVQTERAAHEAWAGLIGRKPKAAQLLHLLVANMGRNGAVVTSQATLATLMGVSVNTVKRSLTVLGAENWVDIVRVGSERGGVNAYVVNRRVAWADKRSNQRYAAFDARILVSTDEQDASTIAVDRPNLRQLPSLSPGDLQLPAGDGLKPPNQPSIDGLEPDLPSLHRDPNTNDMFDGNDA